MPVGRERVAVVEKRIVHLKYMYLHLCSVSSDVKEGVKRGGSVELWKATANTVGP